MDSALEAYIQRSDEIRRLSTSLEREGESAAVFYARFRRNFSQIRRLLQENKDVLQRRVYRPLKRVSALNEATADELMSFSDALANTRTLEMVDVPLAWLIADTLEPYYARLEAETGDAEHRRKHIHCLFRRQVLAYNAVQSCDRSRLTDELSKVYWDCIAECSRKMLFYLDDLEVFSALPEPSQQELITMELFSATAYERRYYDPEMIRRQIECYQRHIRRLSDPAFQAAAKPEDLAFDVASAHNYLAAVHEFLYWNDVPEDILRVLGDSSDHVMHYIDEHPGNFRFDRDYAVSTRRAIGFYRGQVSLAEMLSVYEQSIESSVEHSYDFMDMDVNLLPLIFVLWLCARRPERIDECRGFLRREQARTFAYIQGAREQGAYHTMQRYTGYIIDDYLEIEDGVPFQDYFENLLAATQPTLYVHSRMVDRIASAMLDELYRQSPERLEFVCGCESMAELDASIDRVHDFLHHCCLFHDAGKLFFLDTINLYNRALFPEEFARIQLHPLMGWLLLNKRPSTRPYADAALYHHKWYDEKGGYPTDASFGGDDNAILYQIITCADCIDAATDSVGRAYGMGKSLDDMIADLRINSGRMFNPALVELFDDPDFCRRIEQLLTVEREQLYHHAFAKRAAGE